MKRIKRAILYRLGEKEEKQSKTDKSTQIHRVLLGRNKVIKKDTKSSRIEGK